MCGLAKVSESERDKLLLNAFHSDSMKGIFSILFEQEVYEGISDEVETKKYFPLQDVYAVIGICKILQDELACHTLNCSSVSDYINSQMFFAGQYQTGSKMLNSLENHPYLDNYITGRIDLKFLGGGDDESGNIEVLNLIDPMAEIKSPSWINKNGCGYVISSKSGAMTMTFRCRQTGTLIVTLRGLDVRNKEGKRIPFWIDYTMFQVNDVKIFDQIHTVCHDMPYQYRKDVQAEETVTLLIEWLPHDERNGAVADPSETNSARRSIWRKLYQRIRNK